MLIFRQFNFCFYPIISLQFGQRWSRGIPNGWKSLIGIIVSWNIAKNCTKNEKNTKKCKKTQKIQSVHMVARLFRTWNTARFCVVCYFRFLLGLNYDVNVKIWSLFSTHMPLRLEKRQKMGQLSLEFSRYSRKIEKTDFGENLHHDFFTRVIFQGHHSWPAKFNILHQKPICFT